MKIKNILPCLLACALLGLTGCTQAEPQNETSSTSQSESVAETLAQAEPISPDLDASQIASGEVFHWSIGYGAPLTQEDLAQALQLLQPQEGSPLPNANPEPINGGVPTIQFTQTDGSQLTVTLYGRNGIDLIVTTSDGETCYDVEQEQLDPVLEIIESYDPPEIPQ